MIQTPTRRVRKDSHRSEDGFTWLSSSGLYRGRPYYGWVIVCFAALTAFFTGPGQTYSIGGFSDSFTQEFGWSRSKASSLFALATVASGFCMSSVGAWIDRKGTKRASWMAGIGFAMACYFNSIASGETFILLGLFLARFFGQGTMSLLARTIVPKWFIKKRGRATALMGLGYVASQTITPLLNAFLIEHLGWRGAWMTWGLLLAGVYVPVSQKLCVNTPEDMSLLPDGGPVDVDLSVTVHDLPKPHRSFTLRQASRMSSFWVLLWCCIEPSAINTAVIFHMSSIIKNNGLAPGYGPMVLTAKALVGFPVSLCAGYLLDRYKPRFMLSTTYVLQCIFLLLFGYSTSIEHMYIAGILFGIAATTGNISSSLLLADWFGTAHLGAIQGAHMTGNVMGSAVGPIIFALCFDATASYHLILMACAPLGLLTAAAVMLAPDPQTYKARKPLRTWRA